MKIGGSSFLQSQIGSTQAREWQRQDVQQTQREQEKARRRDVGGETFDVDVQITDSTRRTSQQRQVMASSGSASTQRGPQYYRTPDHSSLSARDQRALRTYSDNQGLGRTVDVNAGSEFLGTVDVFV